MRLSFHFGLNNVDRSHYDGWDGLLKNPRNDCAVMASFAALAGFKATTRYDGGVTRQTLADVLLNATPLTARDQLLLTFSGHGSMDEAICLWDGLFYDSELHNAIAPLACDTVVILDSCFAGGMDKDYDPRLRKRVLPRSVDLKIRRDAWPPAAKEDVQGRYLLLAAASNTQYALDGYGHNGAFTECLAAAFQAARAARQNFTWREWLNAAAGRCALEYPTQTPQLKIHGPDGDALADSNVSHETRN